MTTTLRDSTHRGARRAATMLPGLAGLVLAGVLTAPAPAGSFIDLGAASDFTVLGLNGAKISLTNPQSGIDGTVGLGPGGRQSFSSGFITGDLLVDPTADNSKSNDVVLGGSTLVQDLTQAVADALAASAAAAALVPDLTFGDIKNATTITGTGGLTTIALGSISFSGSDDVLTISGTENDYFVFNVAESIKLSHQHSAIRLDGVPLTNVLFNFLGEGDALRTSGNASVAGIFLAPWGKMTISPGRFEGSLIAGDDIALTSGAQLQGPMPVLIPLPAPVLLGALGLAGVLARRAISPGTAG